MIKGNLIYLGIALLLTGACVQKTPDLDLALELYQQGHINQARRIMGDYIRVKPFNDEVQIATQHILLARRIKYLESVAVEQWKRGNTAGASRIVGVLRFLHPVYVDSAQIFQHIDFSRPPSAGGSSIIHAYNIPDSLLAAVRINTKNYMNNLQLLLISLSSEIEIARLAGLDPQTELEVRMSNPPLTRQAAAYRAAQATAMDPRAGNRFLEDLQSISEHTDSMLTDLREAGWTAEAFRYQRNLVLTQALIMLGLLNI